MKLYFNSKSVYIHVSTSICVAFFCTFICRGLYCISFIHVRIARCTLSSMLCYLRLWTVHHNSYQDSRDTSSCQALGSECVSDRVSFKPRLNTPWCIEKSISIEHEIDHSPAGHTQGSSHHDSISGIRREANYAVFFFFISSVEILWFIVDWLLVSVSLSECFVGELIAECINLP